MVDQAKNLAGINDIIEPDAVQLAQHTDGTIAVFVLLTMTVFLYLVYVWKSPLSKARRRYKTIIKHQNIWSAAVIGAELKVILAEVSRAKRISHKDNNSTREQIRELCNQLRFSGISPQSDTVEQALQVTQKLLWPV